MQSLSFLFLVKNSASEAKANIAGVSIKSSRDSRSLNRVKHPKTATTDTKVYAVKKNFLVFDKSGVIRLLTWSVQNQASSIIRNRAYSS